jgi:hypothetical protein
LLITASFRKYELGVLRSSKDQEARAQLMAIDQELAAKDALIAKYGKTITGIPYSCTYMSVQNERPHVYRACYTCTLFERELAKQRLRILHRRRIVCTQSIPNANQRVYPPTLLRLLALLKRRRQWSAWRPYCATAMSTKTQHSQGSERSAGK